MKRYKFIEGADFPDENFYFEKNEIRYGKIKNPNEPNENRVIVTIYKNGKSIDVPLKVSEGLYLLQETKMFTASENKTILASFILSLTLYATYKYFENKQDGRKS